MEAKNTYIVKYFIIMLICFTIDSVISYFLPSSFSKDSIYILPCISLMMYTLLVPTIEGAYRYFFGAVCGLYYSIVYCNSLAIYIVIYVIIAFVLTYIIRVEGFSIIEAFLFAISTILVQEVVVYWLMKITSVTSMAIYKFILLRLLPTLIFNAVLFIVVYLVYNQIKLRINIQER